MTKKKKGLLLAVIVIVTAVLVGLLIRNMTREKGRAVDSSDTAAIVAEVKDKYSQDEYKDKDTGLTVPYNISLPESYDGTKEYPMVFFIGDLRTAGNTMAFSLEQGWGGTVWATEEVRKVQECIVVTAVYPDTVIDDRFGELNVSEYVDLTPRMISSIAEKYHADPDRIYGTGQSMGAMTTLYLAANYPDLYAAVLIVDGQWDITALKGLESQKMIYITAGGDEKATNGQTEVKEMLKKDGIPYSELSDVDVTEGPDAVNQAVSEMLKEGNAINFITWKTGSVLVGTDEKSEHNAAFDYGYRYSSVRNWILQQEKE